MLDAKTAEFFIKCAPLWCLYIYRACATMSPSILDQSSYQKTINNLIKRMGIILEDVEDPENHASLVVTIMCNVTIAVRSHSVPSSYY